MEEKNRSEVVNYDLEEDFDRKLEELEARQRRELDRQIRALEAKQRIETDEKIKDLESKRRQEVTDQIEDLEDEGIHRLQELEARQRRELDRQIKALEDKQRQETSELVKELEAKINEEISELAQTIDTKTDEKLLEAAAKNKEDLDNLENKTNQLVNDLEIKVNEEIGEIGEIVKNVEVKVDEKLLEVVAKNKEDLDKQREETNILLSDLESRINQKITNEIKELETKQREETKQLLDNLEIKIGQEITQQVKELENETDKKLKELEDKQNIKFDEQREEINRLVKGVEGSVWILGEYKWMPINSTMPKGWFKIAIPKGYGIVQGNNAGLTTGRVKKHGHWFHKKNVAWGYSAGTPLFYYRGLANQAKQYYIPTIRQKDTGRKTDKTDGDGYGIDEKNNFGAGLYAELWQYQGVNNEWVDDGSWNKIIDDWRDNDWDVKDDDQDPGETIPPVDEENEVN